MCSINNNPYLINVNSHWGGLFLIRGQSLSYDGAPNLWLRPWLHTSWIKPWLPILFFHMTPVIYFVTGYNDWYWLSNRQEKSRLCNVFIFPLHLTEVTNQLADKQGLNSTQFLDLFKQYWISFWSKCETKSLASDRAANTSH